MVCGFGAAGTHVYCKPMSLQIFRGPRYARIALRVAILSSPTTCDTMSLLVSPMSCGKEGAYHELGFCPPRTLPTSYNKACILQDGMEGY